MSDDYYEVTEWCPECDTVTTHISKEIEPFLCSDPMCRKILLPCSMCDMDEIDCCDCPYNNDGTLKEKKTMKINEQDFSLSLTLIDQVAEFSFVKKYMKNCPSLYMILNTKTNEIEAFEQEFEHAKTMWENYKPRIATFIGVDIKVQCSVCNSFFYVADTFCNDLKIICNHCGAEITVTDKLREADIKIQECI